MRGKTERTLSTVANSIIHPVRERQRALGELYETANNLLRTDETQFFTGPGYNIRRHVLDGDQKDLVVYTDTGVTSDNEISDYPSTIVVKNGGRHAIDRADDGKFSIKAIPGKATVFRSSRSRRVPTKVAKRVTDSLRQR